MDQVSDGDAAIGIADGALMGDDLGKPPRFIRLSRATVAVLRQNIGPVFAGEASPWMAMFSDTGASLLVVGKGLRLLRR